MKILRTLALCLATALVFSSCDKNDSTDDTNKVYLVKKLIITSAEESYDFSFYYDNGKITKIAFIDIFGDNDEVTLSYTSETTIKVKANHRDDIVTLDPQTKVISKREPVDNSYTGNCIFSDGHFTKDDYGGEAYEYMWTDGNLTNMKYGNKVSAVETISNVEYSNVVNNTNLDIYLWIDANCDDELRYIYTTQFIKNVSRNVPSSIKYSNEDAPTPITTILDANDRPSQLKYGGTTYTFEYFD